VAAAQARQALARFRYLGYLDRGGKAQAFLSYNNELITVQRGETVQGRFYMKDVTPTRVVIVESATKVEVSLTLSAER
jgi:Tfp pilus assembly protein PilP